LPESGAVTVVMKAFSRIPVSAGIFVLLVMRSA